MTEEKPNISLIIPFYNDFATVDIVISKALFFLKENSKKYELIIINDASPDGLEKILEKYKKNPKFKIFNNKKNEGYGNAIKRGLEASKYEVICNIDGDDEYEMEDLGKMLPLIKYYGIIIAFRYKKLYSTKRILISYIYNLLLRVVFKTKFRDVSTGIRIIKKESIRRINLHSESPFIGAEIAIKSMFAGIPIGEVGIQTFPRVFNKGSSVTLKNISKTIKDLIYVYKEIFSDNYDLPENRLRK